MARRSRAVIIAAAFAASMLALAACSSTTPSTTPSTTAAASGENASWKSVVAGAEKEGTVTYYSNDNAPVDQAIIAAFEKKYPDIKVNYTRLSDQDIVSRVLQEASSGINAADVVRSGVPDLTQTNKDGIFTTLTPKLVPALADYPKDAFRHPWAVITAYSEYAVAYNTSTVPKKDVPKTWKDVLNPTFKGQIDYVNPVGSATHMGWLSAMQDDYGKKFLTDFGKMGFDVQASGTPAAQAVAAGSGKLALVVYAGNVTTLTSQGAPIKYVIPTPVLVKPDSLVVMSKAAHPDAARVFADFRLSPEGIAAMCSATVAGSPQPDAPDCAKVPAKSQLVKDLWTPAEALPYITAVGLKPAS